MYPPTLVADSSVSLKLRDNNTGYKIEGLANPKISAGETAINLVVEFGVQIEGSVWLDSEIAKLTHHVKLGNDCK